MMPPKGYYRLKPELIEQTGWDEVIYCTGTRRGNKFLRNSRNPSLCHMWKELSSFALPDVHLLNKNYDFSPEVPLGYYPPE